MPVPKLTYPVDSTRSWSILRFGAESALARSRIGRCLLGKPDTAYYRKRATEERSDADMCADERVRKVHLDFAMAYEARAEACAIRQVVLHPVAWVSDCTPSQVPAHSAWTAGRPLLTADRR